MLCTSAVAGRIPTFQSLCIAGFLTLQVAAPLHYYLGNRGDDERFAWRMFSSRRMLRCRIRVVDVRDNGEGGSTRRSAPMKRELHQSWITLLKRNRPAVVEAYLAHRCRQDGVLRAEYIRECRQTDGRMLTPSRTTLSCPDIPQQASPP